MSAQSIVYLYNQKQLVVLLEHSSSPRRYEKVYSKELKVNKGVDNILEFAFLNQEQKPVNITGRIITCRIIDRTGKETLAQKSLTHTYPLKGITTLVLTKDEVDSIDAQRCFYTLEVAQGEYDLPVFVDEESGGRGIINIVDSILPSYVPSKEISIPSHLPPSLGTSRTYMSSMFSTEKQSRITMQLVLDSFTGSIEVLASNTPGFSETYTVISPLNHTSFTGSTLLDIVGYHPYMKVKVTNSGTGDTFTGDVSQILVR